MISQEEFNKAFEQAKYCGCGTQMTIYGVIIAIIILRYGLL